MHSGEKQFCEELLWDMICYELCCDRLSPEMKQLLEVHLAQCSSCRHRVLDFMSLLQESMPVRNYG